MANLSKTIKKKRIFDEEKEILGIIAKGEREYKERKLKSLKSLKEFNY